MRIKSKYNSVKKVINGIKFDSTLEADAYSLLVRNNVSFDRQIPFVLQEAFKLDGKTIRAITYVADFQIFVNGITYVIDTKGMETDVFKIKKKMMLKKFSEMNGYKFLLIRNLNEMREFIIKNYDKLL